MLHHLLLYLLYYSIQLRIFCSSLRKRKNGRMILIVSRDHAEELADQTLSSQVCRCTTLAEGSAKQTTNVRSVQTPAYFLLLAVVFFSIMRGHRRTALQMHRRGRNASSSVLGATYSSSTQMNDLLIPLVKDHVQFLTIFWKEADGCVVASLC